MSDLMPKEFYDAFRKHFGFGQLTASASSDAYQMLKAAEWAWQASRECLVIDLPKEDLNIDYSGYVSLSEVEYSIHAAGVKTK